MPESKCLINSKRRNITIAIESVISIFMDGILYRFGRDKLNLM